MIADSRHFFLKRDDILKQCQAWLSTAKADSATARYTGLVQVHNSHLADRFRESPTAYYDAMVPLVKQIESALFALTLPPESDDEDEDDDE